MFFFAFQQLTAIIPLQNYQVILVSEPPAYPFP